MALFFFFFFFFLLLLPLSSPFPQCTDLRAPATLTGDLSFCSSYARGGTSCCDASQDLRLRRHFDAMNVSHPLCASSLKSLLCARCDPFSAELFGVSESQIPILCNSSSSTAADFCSSLWDSCQDALILDSPFAASLRQGGDLRPLRNSTAYSKLTDLWQSKSDFCVAFGGGGGGSRNSSLCFDGRPVSFENGAGSTSTTAGLCLEKLGNGSYINLVPHPDGSNRAFFSNLAGKVFLATVPDQDSGGVLGLDESNPFVDLTDQVYLYTTFGMTGLAFHPDFVSNGRFFAAFNCDRNKSPDCRGTCACNSDVGCDPSQLASPAGGEPCRYHTVIAEYSANGTAASTPSTAKKASPEEVRRIFTMGLPFTADHGGQILFGPADGYLYFMMGDGGEKGDPYNFAQNKKSLLGKIMRLDVNNIPSAEQIASLGLWGNYSTPEDNPHREDKEMQPEIWAYGFRNPWRCSFDSERPSYFLCADIGQDRYEEVDIVSKGGNYGWRVYEGPLLFQPQNSTVANTSSADAVNAAIFPVLGYSHSTINKLGSAAILGGYFYRAPTDPCTYGSYLYGDLYASHIWAAPETPEGSGNFTAKDIPFTCASDSPIKCDFVVNSSLPALQLVFSFGEDNRKDVYVLTESGVYRVVRPSRCNYSCSKEVVSPTNHPTQVQLSDSNKIHSQSSILMIAAAFLLFLRISL